jgi:hypothetical protein
MLQAEAQRDGCLIIIVGYALSALVAPVTSRVFQTVDQGASDVCTAHPCAPVYCVKCVPAVVLVLPEKPDAYPKIPKIF